jgi:cation diffusion facilitator CzcD-associated flavoprotein CzcO
VDAPVSARVVSSLSSVKDNADVVVIGGGLAGLAACNELESKGVDYLLLEASDDVGWESPHGPG